MRERHERTTPTKLTNKNCIATDVSMNIDLFHSNLSMCLCVFSSVSECVCFFFFSRRMSFVGFCFAISALVLFLFYSLIVGDYLARKICYFVWPFMFHRSHIREYDVLFFIIVCMVDDILPSN